MASCWPGWDKGQTSYATLFVKTPPTAFKVHGTI